MSRTKVLDALIGCLDPEDVPVEYIVMAKLTDFDGSERVVKGADLVGIFDDPIRDGIREARIVYNVKKMRKTVVDSVDFIYEEVNRRFTAKG